MIYKDEKGRTYRVMPSVIRGRDLRYVAMFRQPNGLWFMKMPVMPWRKDAAAAQIDLDDLAKRKGWVSV